SPHEGCAAALYHSGVGPRFQTARRSKMARKMAKRLAVTGKPGFHRGVFRLDMRAVFSGVVVAIVCLPAILTFVWFSEVLAGCFALRKERAPPVAVPCAMSHKTIVLVPAHNEGAGMLPTIRDAQAQLGPN